MIQGGSIQEKVNFLVRNAITAGIREQLEPKLQRYVSNVSEIIEPGDILSERGDLLDKTVIAENNIRKEAIQNAIAQITPVITTALGSIFGTIGIIIGGIAGILFGSMISKHSREQEEAQKRKLQVRKFSR